jgi:TPR repeat protein
MNLSPILFLLPLIIFALSGCSSEIDNLKEQAAAGDTNAQFSLGIKYDLGDGVEANRAESIKWHMQAAQNGHAQAQYIIALDALDSGNHKEAIDWSRKSLASGWEDARDIVEQLTAPDVYAWKQRVLGAPKNRMSETCWRTGDTNGFIALAYYVGFQVERDVGQTVKWYESWANNTQKCFEGKPYYYSENKWKEITPALAYLYHKGYPEALASIRAKKSYDLVFEDIKYDPNSPGYKSARYPMFPEDNVSDKYIYEVTRFLYGSIWQAATYSLLVEKGFATPTAYVMDELSDDGLWGAIIAMRIIENNNINDPEILTAVIPHVIDQSQKSGVSLSRDTWNQYIGKLVRRGAYLSKEQMENEAKYSDLDWLVFLAESNESAREVLRMREEAFNALLARAENDPMRWLKDVYWEIEINRGIKDGIIINPTGEYAKQVLRKGVSVGHPELTMKYALHGGVDDIEKEALLLKAYKLGEFHAAKHLGNLYEDQGDFDNADRYYSMYNSKLSAQLERFDENRKAMGLDYSQKPSSSKIKDTPECSHFKNIINNASAPIVVLDKAKKYGCVK